MFASKERLKSLGLNAKAQIGPMGAKDQEKGLKRFEQNPCCLHCTTVKVTALLGVL